MKVRTQLLLFILSAVLAGLALVGVLSYTSSRKILLSEVYGRAEETRQRYQDYLNGYFNGAAKVASGMALAVVTEKEMSEARVHELLKQNLIWNPEIYGLTLFFEPGPKDVGKKLFAPYYFRTGNLIKYIAATPDFRFQDQAWYAEPRKDGRPVWTEPYYDKGAATIMATYSFPMYKGSNFIGVSTVDMSLGMLSGKINAIQIGSTGYALLLSRDGTFLTHPKPKDYVLKKKMDDIALERRDKEFSEFSQMISQKKSGSMSITDPFTEKRSWATFGVIPSTGYSLAIIIPERELLADLKGLELKILWISLLITAVVISLIVMISLLLTRPIKKLSASAREIARGNLRAEIIGSDSNSEIGCLTRDIKAMVKTINQMLVAVREEKEKFERVFTTMTDGIAATDAFWKVINYNNAASRMLGISIGDNLIDKLSNDFKTSFKLAELLDAKKLDKNIELVRPETDQVGEMIFSGVINTIVDPEGNVASYVLTIRDVTEEKKESFNKANLLSVVSHKLRTPLTVLMGTAGLLEDRAFGELTEKQEKHIKKLISQANQVEKLVGRLVDYVSLSAHEKDAAEDVDVEKVIDEIAEKMRKISAGEKNIDVETLVEPKGLSVRVCRKHVELIIAELIENAVKFNRNKDVVMKISAEKKGNRLFLTVKDNGIGIAAIHLDKIFEKFFQVDKDFTGNTEGVGLGLSLVKTIVERHSGVVTVDSKEGAGSSFLVEIPLIA